MKLCLMVKKTNMRNFLGKRFLPKLHQPKQSKMAKHENVSHGQRRVNVVDTPSSEKKYPKMAEEDDEDDEDDFFCQLPGIALTF